MSKFASSYKLAIGYARGNDASHCWIALHRCVEALARSKGQSFNSIFEHLEKQFFFKRKNKAQWPSIENMLMAAYYLKAERDIFLETLNFETKIRKIEKKQGKRWSQNKEFLELSHQQNAYKQPRVGYWGWKNRTENQ